MAVYGDYDVDGITSTCLLTDCLSRMGGRILPYIPDRLEEGYGLNAEAVSALAAQGVTLIVTVDCGITAGAETAFAASLGVDVVVTDHHECKENLPPACAVVDPRRTDCPYPFKGLAGVGVALKLAMAVAGPERAEQDLSGVCRPGRNWNSGRCDAHDRRKPHHRSDRLSALGPSPAAGLARLIQEAGWGQASHLGVCGLYAGAPDQRGRPDGKGRLWPPRCSSPGTRTGHRSWPGSCVS